MTQKEKLQIIFDKIKSSILSNIKSNPDSAGAIMNAKLEEAEKKFGEYPELAEKCLKDISVRVNRRIADNLCFTDDSIDRIFSKSIRFYEYRINLITIAGSADTDNKTADAVSETVKYAIERITQPDRSAGRTAALPHSTGKLLDTALRELITDPGLQGDAGRLYTCLEFVIKKLKKLFRENGEITSTNIEEAVRGSYHADRRAELTEKDKQYVHYAASVVTGFFDSLNWQYQTKNEPATGDPIYELEYTVENICILRMSVKIGIETKQCTVSAVLPITLNKYYAYALCKEINDYNRELCIGALHCDEETGSIYYQYTFSAAGGIDPVEFDCIFRSVVASSRDCYSTVKNCCIGRFSRRKVEELRRSAEALLHSFEQKGEEV